MNPDTTSAELLQSYIERIEKLNEDASAIAADIKQIYAEAKSSGLDTKALKKIIALRKKDRDEISEETEIVRLYAERTNQEFAGII